MKIINKIIFVLLLSATTCFSQEEDKFSAVFSSKENSLNELSKFGTNSSQNFQANFHNSIYIQQIGNNNKTIADIKSSNSSISLNQLGTTNSIYLDKNALEINQFVLQDGNNNAVIDFNYKSNDVINSNYMQTGNNLNILSIGSNSISKELTVKQTGNSGSVIILNK